MNYAIEHSNTQHVYLVITPRRKRIKNTLVHVHDGIVLIKVGKQEYTVQAGETFWLPIDCLTSITYLPHSNTSEVNFSIRLPDRFATQAGYVTLNPLYQAAITKLCDSKIELDYKSHLLNVLKHESTDFSPKLTLNETSSRFNRWSINDSRGIGRELHMALTIREARKMLLSGVSTDNVVESLFSGSHSAFEQICTAITGSKKLSK